MKTLYVSDLDGTLLRSDVTISAFTSQTINDLTKQGMLFSYATARSYNTAKKVTSGIDAKIPVIVYNGTFTLDNVTKEIMISNYFDGSIHAVIDDLLAHDVYPIVYSYIDGVEKMSYVVDHVTSGMNDYLQSREGDERLHPIDDVQGLYKGNIFYLTCIDEVEKLMPLFETYKEIYHCVCYQDIYSGEQWFEIMPQKASKANAVLALKQYLQCDRLVVFGDAMNDYDMFMVADAGYAMDNAVDELKQIATGVIGSNNEDAVAKFLLQDFKQEV